MKNVNHRIEELVLIVYYTEHMIMIGRNKNNNNLINH